MSSRHILSGNLREITPLDFNKKKTKRLLRSSVTLPSQHQSYSICVEFAKEWFLEKFTKDYFNSVYVEGKHSFDEFRKFSSIDEQLKRVNPILAIIPTINMENNRQWIDSCPEIPMMLRRTRMEGTFFNDIDDNKALHLQIIFKTILMNFTYKIRLNTRAEELDMCEFIKLKHRAGWSETRNIDLDVHVPREIIAQIAYDNGYEVDDNLNIKEPFRLLDYLNKHSLIPFIYKLRCSNGNNEFFIKVPNCVAHIKSELPSIDDGERQGVNSTNYTVEFTTEIEMTAPYAYTYFSEREQRFINANPVNADGMISVMRSIKTEVPPVNKKGWDLFVTTDYLVEEEDLKKEIVIDFDEYFKNTDLKDIIEYTKKIAINPALFIDFKLFNDGIERTYEIDWNTLKCKILEPIENITTVIGIYCDMGYINNTLIQLKEIGKSRID